MFEYKEKYTIDFTNVKHYLEMHFIIKKELDFPDYYGCNWSAFWDCLTDMVGDAPIHIEIRGIEVIEQKFDDVASKMIGVLKRFQHYENDEFINDITIEIVDGDKRTLIE